VLERVVLLRWLAERTHQISHPVRSASVHQHADRFELPALRRNVQRRTAAIAECIDIGTAR